MADIQHAAIPDANLHEPKGVVSATVDQVYLADGLGSGVWGSPADSVFPVADKWAEIFISPTSVVLPGGTDPGRDSADGSLLFDSVADEQIFTQMVIPRDRIVDTDLRFYVYWAKTTSATGDVAWTLDYKILALNAVTSGGWTTLITEAAPLTTDDDTAERTMLTYLDSLDLTPLTNGMTILLRLTRTSTDALDTYGADVRMSGLMATYNRGDLGNDLEFT